MVCLLTTYIVMETNAQQHIIRIRTRMMSCVWLVLATSLPFMHPFGEPIIAAAFLQASYALLFRCYQRHRPQLNVFHAFLMLSLGSFFAPVMLPMAIPFFLYIAVFLRSLTRKAFWAGIIGLIVPYWCYAAWMFLGVKGMELGAGRLPLEGLGIPDFSFALGSLPPVPDLSNIAILALLLVVSSIHYLRTNYDDKIRVRMILYIYVSQTLLLMLFLLLHPAHYQTTMALLVASSSPLIAHYFSLSKGMLNAVFCVLFLLLVVALALLNLWPTAFPYVFPT